MPPCVYARLPHDAAIHRELSRERERQRANTNTQIDRSTIIAVSLCRDEYMCLCVSVCSTGTGKEKHASVSTERIERVIEEQASGAKKQKGNKRRVGQKQRKYVWRKGGQQQKQSESHGEKAGDGKCQGDTQRKRQKAKAVVIDWQACVTGERATSKARAEEEAAAAAAAAAAATAGVPVWQQQ